MKKVLFDLIISIGIGIFLFYLSSNVYAGVYEISIAISVLVSYISVKLINIILKRSYAGKGSNLITIIVLALSIMFVFLTKPNITYLESKDLIISNNYTNVRSLDVKSVLSFNLKRDYFIKNAYLYIAEKNDQTFYVLVGPIDRQLEVFDYYENNYINKYLDTLNGK